MNYLNKFPYIGILICKISYKGEEVRLAIIYLEYDFVTCYKASSDKTYQIIF